MQLPAHGDFGALLSVLDHNESASYFLEKLAKVETEMFCITHGGWIKKQKYGVYYGLMSVSYIQPYSYKVFRFRILQDPQLFSLKDPVPKLFILYLDTDPDPNPPHFQSKYRNFFRKCSESDQI